MMSAAIPQSVSGNQFERLLCAFGLTRTHQGKVRETYELQDDLLLVIATDRVSIFDFVLPVLLPQKGELLTAMTVFWLTDILKGVHHLVAYGQQIDQYLPKGIRELPSRVRDDIRRRALIVRKFNMIPVECIVRGYLTGSGWKSYQNTHQICGIDLPSGLHDGARIVPTPIFTPTTKAKTGHDEHLQTEAVIHQYGTSLRDLSLAVYQQIAEVAEGKELILADTKFEFGALRVPQGTLSPSKSEDIVLADEVGTPDSSRFWDKEEWARAREQRTSPPPFDKEIVRNWGKQFQLDQRDPDGADDLALVRRLQIPPNVVGETTRRYRIVFQRLTGLTLAEFQEKKFGVA